MVRAEMEDERQKRNVVARALGREPEPRKLLGKSLLAEAEERRKKALTLPPVRKNPERPASW